MKYLANATAYATLIETLTVDGGTIKDMAEETGLHYTTVRKLVYMLRKRELVYVCSWAEDRMGRRVHAVYKMGAKEDARRPPPLTRAQRDRRRHERMSGLAQCLGLTIAQVRRKEYVLPPLSTTFKSKGPGVASAA